MTLTLKEHIGLARQKDCPAHAIETPDEFATCNDIVQMFGNIDTAPPIIAFDIASGARALTPAADTFVMEMNDRITPPGPVPEVLTYLRDNLPKHRESPDTGEVYQKAGVVIFLGYHHGLESPDKAFIIQATRNLFPAFKGTKRTFIALGPVLSLPQDLEGEMLRYQIPYPNRETCEQVVRAIVEDANGKAKPDSVYVPPADDVIYRASLACVGMKSPAVVEQAVALSIGSRFGGLSVERINDIRISEVNNIPGLSVERGGRTFAKDYKGNQPFVEYLVAVLEGRLPITCVVRLEEFADALRGSKTDLSGTKGDIHQRMLNYMSGRPCFGVYCCGAAGTGKTLGAECAANYKNTIGLTLDINATQGGLVGQTTAQMSRALDTIDALAGDGMVLFIATSNDQEGLTPQMRSRFDTTFMFDLPPAGDGRALVSHYREKWNIPTDDPQPPMVGWTGREIDKACRMAYNLRWPLAKAAARIVPVSISGKAELDALRKMAHGNWVSASTEGVYRMPSATTATATNGQPARRALEVD